jgi:hypothetical protein
MLELTDSFQRFVCNAESWTIQLPALMSLDLDAHLLDLFASSPGMKRLANRLFTQAGALLFGDHRRLTNQSL